MAKRGPIETSKTWLSTAQASMGSGVYNIALYNAEMAVEMALKGVFEELGINPPKVHDIVSWVNDSIEEKRGALPKEFLEEKHTILEVFKTLVVLRPQVGYVHESNLDEKYIESQAKEYVKRAGDIVELCDKAISHIKKNQK